jgi:hypothetical protein
MRQKEIPVLERGQLKIRRNSPKLINVIRKENINLVSVLTDFLAMQKETKSRNTIVSYFTNNVFKGMNEESFILETKPDNLAKHVFEN